LFGEGLRYIRAAIGRDLPPQQLNDCCPPGTSGRLANAQGVKEREQGEFSTQFVACAPEHLAAQIARLCNHGTYERCLADPGLTFDEHRAATPVRGLS